MHAITHLLASWSLADAGSTEGHAVRRDRLIITAAGVFPDLDGLGFFCEMLSRNTEYAVYWFSDYHHVLFHNLGTALGVTAAAALFSIRRLRTACLAAGAFHLHLLCDLVGSRGPEGYPWPIPYLAPFSDAWQWTWQGQWPLNAWPNLLFTFLLILITLHLGWRRGYTVLELLNRRLDAVLVGALRARFGHPITGPAE